MIVYNVYVYVHCKTCNVKSANTSFGEVFATSIFFCMGI